MTLRVMHTPMSAMGQKRTRQNHPRTSDPDISIVQQLLLIRWGRPASVRSTPGLSVWATRSISAVVLLSSTRKKARRSSCYPQRPQKSPAVLFDTRQSISQLSIRSCGTRFRRSSPKIGSIAPPERMRNSQASSPA